MIGGLLILLAAPAFATTCLPVIGERILARDLAAAIPEFTSMPPATPLAYSPAPGAERIFRGAELQRLGKRFGLSLTQPPDVCFALPMRTLQADELVAAMQRTPGFAAATIEIVDFSRFSVPAGEIQFPRSGLGAASESSAGALWNGYIDYGGNHKFAIWARARIAVQMQKVVAVEELKEGRLIEASQVRLEECAASPSQAAVALDLEQVIGHMPRRSIPRGGAVPLNLLSEPNDINRGDIVNIEVRSGAARLALTGRAESAGRLGQRISIRNLQSGRTFTALVAAKGKAVVTASGEPQ